MCEVIAKRLRLNSIECEYLIGDLPQPKRLKIINTFKNGKLKCLLATDVAARGIDVENLAMVINYDIPNEAENYVHRIGRTARAGKSGKAYSFCSEQDVYDLPAIERYIEMSIPAVVADESMFEEDKSAGIYIKTDNQLDAEQYENKKKTSYHKKSYHGNQGFEKNEHRKSNSIKKTRQDVRKNHFPDDKIQELYNMSFEERMSLYKKKYNSKSDNNITKTEIPKKQKKNTYSKNIGHKNKNNNHYKDSYNMNNAKQKESFFEKIKGFFSRKG